MTTAIVQCPNAACGRVSHLGDDPLGRIFRCPRCLTRLPSAPPSAADSGWTAVIGPPQLRSSGVGFRSTPPRRWAQHTSSAVTGRAWNSPASESGEIVVASFEMDGDREYDHDLGSRPGLGPDDSGEVLIEPFVLDGRSGSGWRSTSRSSIDAVVARQRTSGPIGTQVGPGIDVNLGRFHILSLLGQGEHATVYRAYDPLLERDLALKVPRQGVLKTAKAVDRFLGEGRALARLRHPRIVPVYEAGYVGGRHYIAMALIEGRSLAEQLAEHPIALYRAAEIIAELAEALAYAHTEGIVHRDVKPANVRLDDEGAVYLMDFGIAYRPDSGETPLPPGLILGTPAYLAPEQAQGGQTDALPASDQYSLGAIFYELLCRRPPFCGPPSYVLYHTIHHAPPSPLTIVPHVPRALAAICLKALAKSPEQRYDDCQCLGKDLRRWLSKETARIHRRTGRESRS
jgi:eukaryotic-like serine/threonine-protein kinase